MNKQVVLVVDDDADTLELVHVFLEEYAGVEIVLAYDGRQALERLEEVKPDLVLLDVVMPGSSGLQVLAHLKANVATKDTPVIVVSGLTTAWHHALLLGADDYLEKPFDLDTLLDKVSEHLAH